MAIQEGRLLNKCEAATFLKVSTRTLDRIRSAGEIQAVMVRGSVRFDPDELSAYVQDHKK